MILTMLPSYEEIHVPVFALNKDSVARPDGFGSIFFQTFWSIIKKDVVNSTIQFFKNSWILLSYNDNTLILIPKVDEADSIDSKKIITKIIVDRLAKNLGRKKLLFMVDQSRIIYVYI